MYVFTNNKLEYCSRNIYFNYGDSWTAFRSKNIFSTNSSKSFGKRRRNSKEIKIEIVTPIYKPLSVSKITHYWKMLQKAARNDRFRWVSHFFITTPFFGFIKRKSSLFIYFYFALCSLQRKDYRPRKWKAFFSQ